MTAPDTRPGSRGSLRHPHTLPHSLPKHARLTRSPQTYLLRRPHFPHSLQKHAPTTPGPRAHFRLRSRRKHARTHCRACKDPECPRSPRALESRVLHLAPPTLFFLTLARSPASTRAAPTPARAPASTLAPPPRAHSLGRGSTVTLGPPGAQPPVPGSPPRPAPPESLHSTRRRWNDALGSGSRGLPATA